MLLESMRAPCKPDKVPVTPRSSKMRLVFNFQITPWIFLKIFHFSSPTSDYTMHEPKLFPLFVSHFQKRKKQTSKQTNKTKQNKNKPNMIQFLTVIILSGVGMGNTQEIRKFVNNGSIFQEKIPTNGYFILPIKMHGSGGGGTCISDWISSS